MPTADNPTFHNRDNEDLLRNSVRKPIGKLVKQLAELPRPAAIEARDEELLPERSAV